MRIIAGRFRSRKLLTPRDAATTRPMPDRVKESLFSMLRGNTEGAQVLDCFAGTGAVGLEALSRGAERAVFVEKDRRAADLLERNIAALGAEEECEVVRADALGPAALTRCPRPVDLVFFDPPYPLVLDPERWPHVRRQVSRLVELLSPDGFFVLRTPWPFRHLRVIDQQGHEIPHGDARNPFDIYGHLRKDTPPPSGRRFKGRREKLGGGRTRHEDEEDRPTFKSWEGDVDVEAIEQETAEDEAILDAIAEGGPLAARGLKVFREDVGLEMDGAKGPETHVYASQAVHLYVRGA